MKLRTWVALGVGYAIGAKLGPQQIGGLINAALGSDDVTVKRVTVPNIDDPAVQWPDASFRI